MDDINLRENSESENRVKGGMDGEREGRKENEKIGKKGFVGRALCSLYQYESLYLSFMVT
jgi:hypothetical protein